MKVARDSYGGGVENWLATLLALAAQSGWPHLDLLIDQANLPPRWQKKLPQALTLRQMLLQGTVHAEVADEAALLCRYQLADERARTKLLACLGGLEGASRLMVLHSDWPFASLANHLSYFCLAQWHDGRSHGVLRYYNPQQFLPGLAALPETRATMLLQCADCWHWLDRDGIACQLPVPGHADESFLPPDEPLTLDDAAVSRLSAWHQAELYVQDMLLTPRQCGCTGKEAMLEKVYRAQLAADARQYWSQPERESFLQQQLGVA